MYKTFSFVALGAALGFGCVVSGDDSATTTTTGPNTSTSADDDGNDDVDPSTTNSSVGNDSSTGTPPGDSSGSSGGGTTMADDTASDGTATGVGGGCGWGKTGDKMFPEGYICDGEGKGPDVMFPLACPEDADLTAGADCGDIRAQGCCDANGDLWFCADAGDGTELVTEDCA
jgi:hypothetical protein